jgi:MFS family permease
MAGAMLWLIQPLNLPMLYLFAAIFGLAYGGIGPPIVAQIGDIFGLRHLGVIMGVLSVAWGAGSATGSTLGGYTFDISDSYVPAFLAGMVAMLIAAALIFFLRTPTAKTRDETIQ